MLFSSCRVTWWVCWLCTYSCGFNCVLRYCCDPGFFTLVPNIEAPLPPYHKYFIVFPTICSQQFFFVYIIWSISAMNIVCKFYRKPLWNMVSIRSALPYSIIVNYVFKTIGISTYNYKIISSAVYTLSERLDQWW